MATDKIRAVHKAYEIAIREHIHETFSPLLTDIIKSIHIRCDDSAYDDEQYYFEVSKDDIGVNGTMHYWDDEDLWEMVGPSLGFNNINDWDEFFKNIGKKISSIDVYYWKLVCPRGIIKITKEGVE